jgi:hypothetical protein
MLGRIAAAFAALSVCTSGAIAVDLHQFWDSRCSECHGHAGPFARQHLTVQNGKLTGTHNADLKRFLERHESGAAQAGPLYDMLLAQVQTKPVFQQKCAGCHETAAQFARTSLTIRDGVVVGKASGQPIAEFLKRHGKLAPDEVPIVVESLTRILGELGGPAK